MYFDFDTPVADMANTNPQQQQTAAVSMQQLLNNNPVPTSQPIHMQWSSQSNPQETLPAMQLPNDPHHNHHLNRHPLAQPSHYPPQPVHPQEHHRNIPPEKNNPRPTNTYELDDSPPIEPHIVMQMGGLPYADLCKEKAREAFKEMKKNEHMAKGEFDRMKRRKKGDTSMTPREKYVRRLKMNQDSAAAARYAQEVYVHVLEKLVKTTEEEKKGFILQVQQLQNENARLKGKVHQLQTSQPVDALFEAPEKLRKVYGDAQLSKLIDMMTDPETVSAQDNDPNFAAGNMGTGPAHAA